MYYTVLAMTDGGNVTDSIPVEDLLEQIIRTTKNDIIVFTIVIGLFLILAIPLIIRMRSKTLKSEETSRIANQKLLLDVIKENTGAITSLKTTLDLNNATTLELLQSIANKTMDASANVASIIIGQENLIKTIAMNMQHTDSLYGDIKQQNAKLEARLDFVVEKITKNGIMIDDLAEMTEDIHGSMTS